MSRQTSDLTTHYSICVVCEGDKTEPGFVGAYHNWIKGRQELSYELTIIPNPNNEEVNTKRKKRVIAKRQTAQTGIKVKERPFIHEPKPLNWVREGLDYLKTYAEVWVMFDKDGHPKIKEAFELIQQERNNGKNIHLVFSSRCFEMYLLQHFEFNNKCFDECECGEKLNGHTRSYHCCTVKAVKGKACTGDKCINGYARLHGYWQESKNDKTFHLVDNVWRGIVNAHKLSCDSIQRNCTKPVYSRNPYLNTYLLFLRLAEIKPFRNIDQLSIAMGAGYYCTITRNGNIIKLENNAPISFKLYLAKSKACKLAAYDKDNRCEQLNSYQEIKDQVLNITYVIEGNTTRQIDFSAIMAKSDFVLLDINDCKYFFGNEPILPSNFDKSLFDLA